MEVDVSEQPEIVFAVPPPIPAEVYVASDEEAFDRGVEAAMYGWVTRHDLGTKMVVVFDDETETTYSCSAPELARTFVEYMDK